MREIGLVTVLLAVPALAQDRLDRAFEHRDRNGDGKLSRAELPFPGYFRRADADGDGFVSRTEFLRARQGARGRARRPAAAQAPEPPQVPVERHLDIPYTAVEGVPAKLLSLDLYAPKKRAEGKRPVVVMIHGGGWRRGDKASAAMTQYKVPHFVGRGYVYISINYRLSTAPGIRHPVHVLDVAKALAWVHDHVATYGGDPRRIFVMGHSAGAHLAALVATDHRRLEAAGKSLAIVQGAICLDTAAYDVPRYVNELGAGPQMRRMYEAAFGKTEKEWRDASPRHHVAKDKGIPPLLFVHTGRRMAGETLSKELVAALRAAGTAAQAIHAADKDHAGINRCIGQAGDPYTALVMRFLERPQDANKLTLESQRNADTDKGPSAAARGPAITVDWQADYRAGVRDENGKFMGGTETMRLIAHRGMLFAGVGYWTDQRGDDPRPGGQILVKRSAGSPWRLERSFPNSLRVNCMESVGFCTGDGNKAVSLLLADASRMGSRGQSGPLRVWVRDDQDWHESEIRSVAPNPFVRAFGSHRDQKTGVDLVFAGTRAGEIYSGVYDADATGHIRWNPRPEYRNPDFDGQPFKRVSAFCVANGAAYCSVAPRLMRRRDGEEPGWEEVYHWQADLNRNGAGLRGITAVPSADGKYEVILGAWERAGRILRIDPRDGFKAALELDSRAFLRERLGGFYAGGLTAYNRFVPGRHPRTGKPIHWVTVAGFTPDDQNAAWLLIRNADRSYETVRVSRSEEQPQPRLISTRTLEIAPWNPDEIYTGGYDGAANKRRNHNTAWIHRGPLLAPARTTRKKAWR